MHRTIFEPEHEQFRDTVRKFMQAEVSPNADRWREAGIVDRDVYLKAGGQGLLCVFADENYGGAAIADLRFDQIIVEENMRHGDIGFYINLHNNMVAPYIHKLGNKEQKDRFMPGIVSGCLIVFAWTLSAFPTPELLGGGKVKMIANVVKDLGLDSFNWPGAAAFAMLALALTLALLTVVGRLSSGRAT